MAKVPLRTYIREIETLIERGNTDEAISHSRHILKTFPKHLDSYRALGRAFLESKGFPDAADIFKRVLASAPDDFISHVGMSIIHDDQKKQDETIWHMERAFETQPSNAAIQSELQRLYGRRDGREPHKIRLTRGALARMYVHGGLYAQAIGEIRSVLADEPTRVDMQVLLALAYFRSGQKVEASEACSQLISRYPYCLDANRILVEILPGTGMAENAQTYRSRVIELDPYAAYVSGSIFQSGDVADNAVTIERLEYKGQPADTNPAWESKPVSSAPAPTPQSDWTRTPANQTPAAPAEPDSSEAAPIPDWMRNSGWGESSGAFEESAASAEESPNELAKAEIPDWIKSMAPPAEATAAASSAAASDDTMAWLNKLSGDSPFAEKPQEPSPKSDLPDWISDFGEPESPAAPAPGASATAPSLDWLAEQPPAADLPPAVPATDLPNWISELGAPASQQQSAAPPPAPEPQKVEPPAPASPASSAPGFAIGDLGTSSADQDAAMLWLESLAAKGGAKSEELITNPQERLEKPPEWVEQARVIGKSQPMTVKPEASPLEPSAPTAPGVASSLGDLGTSSAEQDAAMLWLESLAAKGGAKSEELITNPQERLEKPPEWVEQARVIGESQPSSAESEAVPPEEAVLPPESAWLPRGTGNTGAFGSASTEEPVMDATSAWLRDLAEKDEADKKETSQPSWEEEKQPAAWSGEIEVTPPAQKAESRSESDLPSWLRDLEKRESAPAPAAPSDDMPDWLKGEEPAEEALPPEPTQPTDWIPETPKVTPPAAPEPERAKPATFDKESAARFFEEEGPLPIPNPIAPSMMPAAKPTPAAKPAAAQQKAAPQKKEPHKPPEPVPASTPVDTRVRRTGMLPPLVDPALASAREALSHGKIPDALQVYGNLIRKGKLLEDVTFDLKEALYRFPVEVSIWQALGDAYMRANRLQDALDSYTKAEELLR